MVARGRDLALARLHFELSFSRNSVAATRVPDDKSLLAEHGDRLTPASRLCVGNLLVSTQAALP